VYPEATPFNSSKDILRASVEWEIEKLGISLINGT
jgi:hypothetical protein